MGENTVKQFIHKTQKPNSLVLFVIVLLSTIFAQNILISTKTTSAATGVPVQINFQGRLTAVSNGTNVTNGTYAIRFKLYDALTSGSLLWTETYDQAPTDPCQKVQVTAGVFNVKLGSCASLSGVDFTSDSLYLSIDFAPSGTSYDGEMSPRKRLVSSPYAINANNLAGSGKIDLTNTSTTTSPFKLTANTLTTASGLTVTTTNNSAANTAWTGSTLTFNNAQGTTAVSTGSIAGLDIQFNQNTSVAANNETAARINIKQNNSSSTDATVASILDLANNDTVTGNQITVTDALKITGTNITNGINLSGTFGGNLITSTNFIVTQSGQITSGALAGGGSKCLQTDNSGVISAAAAACGTGGSNTLQQTYGFDADGSDATISLTTDDDSIIITNPSSSGTDSTFVLKVDQAANAALDALIITNAGTGTIATLDASNASGNGVLIDVQSSSSSQYALKVTSNNGSTNGLYVRADGNVGIGTTTASSKLTVAGNGTGIALIGDATYANYAGISLNGLMTAGNYNFLSSASDKDLYINRPTGEEIIFRENNSTQMTLGTGGNLGLGAAADSTVRFLTQGSGTSSSEYAFVVRNSTPTNIISVRNDAAVSINTPSYIAGSTIVGGSNKTTLTLYSDSNLNILMGDAYGQDKGGTLSLGGSNGTNLIGFGSIRGAKENATSGNSDGYLALYTAIAGTGTVERMRIDSVGRIGIGTSSSDARLEIAGSLTQSAWGVNGIALQGTAATYTDSSTSGSGTAASAVFNSFGIPTLAATNSNVTTTNAATVYIAGAPTAGSNQTITSASALWIQNGNLLLNTNSSFSAPTLAGGFDTSGQNINSVYVSGKYAYIGQSANAGTCSGVSVTGCEFAILDIHNPSNPLGVGGVNVGKTVNTIFISGKYAYVGSNSDAGTCSSTTLTGCEFSIYNITNPGSPTAVIGYSLNQNLNSIFISGKYAYLGFETDNSTGTEFVILDLSNINGTNVSAIGSFDTADATSGEGSIKAVYVQGRYAYLGLSSTTGTACSSADATSCDFRIYDISNPYSPTYKGGTNTLIDVKSVYASGKYAYIGMASVSGNDFSSYNIADPTAPGLIGGLDLSSSANSIQIAGRYAFVGKASVSGNDFQILDITDPTTTVLNAGGVDVGFDVRSVYVSGKYAYIGTGNTANGAYEFRVLDIGGVDTPTVTTATAGIGQLSVSDNARIDNDLYVGNSLNIGASGINSAGPVTIENILTGQSSGAGVAGVYGNYTLTNTTNSVFQYGNRFITNITATEDSNVDSTYIGELIRIVDTDCDTGATTLDCDNTVRGLEVQSWTGNNTAGTNTAIAGFGKTFGLQGTTDALAGGVSQPAAVYADLDNGSATTVGNAIRAYTDNATSATLVQMYQEKSAYTGTGLLMNFGTQVTGTGSYAGNFIDLQYRSSSKMSIAYSDVTSKTTVTVSPTGSIFDWASATDGNTFVWKMAVRASGTCSSAAAEGIIFQTTGGTQTGHICMDNSTNKLKFYAEAFNATSTDLAENYADKDNSLTAGDVVTLDPETYKGVKKATNAYETNLMGVISTSPGLLLTDLAEDGSQSTVVHPKPLALAGRVPVKISNENGEVKVGDYLTSSPTKAGFAMKADKAGKVLGQALENAANKELILAFIKVESWNGSTQSLPISETFTTETTKPVDLLKKLAADTSNFISTIFTDRIISRNIVSDTIQANTLSITSLKSIAEEGLVLEDTTIMNGGLKVDTISSLSNLITFNTNIEFIGTPFFNKDTAGFAKITRGAKEIRVTFETEYLVKPIVTSNLSFERNNQTDQADQLANENLDIEAAFSGVQFVIVNKDTKGFTILLNKKAPRDLMFSWIALAVKDAKTFVSEEGFLDEPIQTETIPVTETDTTSPEEPEPNTESSPSEETPAETQE